MKIDGKSILDISSMCISDSIQFFNLLKLTKHENEIAKRILTEIKNRLEYLEKVGLSYLTLNRKSSTLSGGESQRINLEQPS